ncbi:DMT family transporter [Aureimonas mangrovi]|uniref:DMT family transporter n=1 Tax=Aureimonas mangrovi TaxID=2758041 RepID=UPI00163D9E9A|nr:multidrug efflux SMR transporter [Aureimonas mangrovi]
MAWILLLLAGMFEIVWASAMKLSAGFTRPVPTAAMIVFMFASFFLLAGAMRTLPLGTAYAVWTGIGAVGALVVGIAFFGESASPMRLAAAAMIVGGIALMKLASTS